MLFLVKAGREMKKIITLAYHRVYKFTNENMLRNTDTAQCLVYRGDRTTKTHHVSRSYIILLLSLPILAINLY